MKLSRIQNKFLLSTLFLAFLLRIIGLTPNFQQHPDEPGVIEPANKISTNTILHKNPDPNVEPYPFKYATSVFYMHAIIRSAVLGAGYIVFESTGYTFSLSPTQFGKPSFSEFLTTIGPLAMSDILIWFHRLPSVMFGIATVFLVYKTALLLFKNRIIALFSAAALAVMPHHVRDSHYATVTILQGFFFVLSFLLSTRVWKKTSGKTCALAGLSVGFATSIKYFPISLLPLIFFCFLARKKFTLKLILITTSAILIGYFIGMPYIFVHFQEIVNLYKVAVAWYAPDQSTINQSLIDRLLPSYLHAFHIQFFFKTSVGPILTLAGLLGIFSSLRKWRTETISLLTIPIFNLVFITFYLEAIYETLILPALPFFAIFIGLGTWTLIRHFNKALAVISILTIIFLSPFIDSAKASFACTKTTTEFEAHDWMAENIPEGAVIAHQPNVRFPSKNFEFVRSDPQGKFLLSEIQTTNAEYIVLHSGYTDRYPQWLDDNLFLPKYIKDNEFIHLVLQEYAKNAELLKSFVRPLMCINSRIYIYKIPGSIVPAQTLLVDFRFNDQSALSGWQLGKPGVPSGTSVEIFQTENRKVAKYQYNPSTFSNQINKFAFVGIQGLPPSFYGTPLRSPFIEISAEKKYSAIMEVKRVSESLSQIPDGFLRLDFYEDRNKEPILTRISPRLKLGDIGWQNLAITAKAPTNARFVTISFQTLVATQPSQYLIGEARLLSD